MRRILFLTYHFPPIGGAGAQRSAQLCRHLAAHGYEPVVVTGPGSTDYRWTPRDEGLGTAGTAIHRLPSPEPDRAAAWAGRAERWLRLPMPWRRWWERNVVSAAQRVGSDCDLVYASIAPYQTAESAVAVARSLGRPLVVDLEDPWALDEMLVYPTGLHRALERRRMRRALRAADAIVMSTPDAARALERAFPELSRTLVVAVPNRFDRDDFAAPPPERSDDRFRIVHTGSLHTDLGLRQRSASRMRRALGGSLPGVDFLTRSHVFLLRALDELDRARPELAERIELHLAGVLTDQDLAAAESSRFVRLHGFLPHRDTTALIRSADLLFLPMHAVAPGSRARLVPQKTYEYLASGRPILAAVPDGDARDLLAKGGTADLCGPSDVGAMARILETHVERRRGGEPAGTPRAEVVDRYESRRLAAELTAVFDRVLHADSAAAAPHLSANATLG